LTLRELRGFLKTLESVSKRTKVVLFLTGLVVSHAKVSGSGARIAALLKRAEKLAHRDGEIQLRIVERFTLAATRAKLDPSLASVEDKVVGPTGGTACVAEGAVISHI
jgi:hypothetical protein